MEKILAALRQLDPLNDDHWTVNGDPKIDAVKDLAGVDVTRKEIVDAAPDFNRASSALPDSLIMNRDTKPEEPLVEPSPPGAEDEPEMVDSARQALEMIFDEGPVAEVLGRFFNSAKAMTDNEIGAILGEMEPGDVDTLRVAINDRIEEIRRGVEEMNTYSTGLRRNEMLLKKHLDVVLPQPSNQQILASYISAQNESRLAAAGKRNRILQTIGMQEITPISAIDASMSRKDMRGKTRPSYPNQRSVL